MNIGERIKKRRLELQMTQTELVNCISKHTPITKASVSQWERGHTNEVKYNNIIYCAECLSVTPLWLTTGVISNKDTPSLPSNFDLNENVQKILNALKITQDFISDDVSNDIRVFILSRIQFELKLTSKLYRDILYSYHTVCSLADANDWYEVPLEAQKLIVLNLYKKEFKEQCLIQNEKEVIDIIDIVVESN
jgi:transcriptional regulator with XRE-family HTH domain